MKTESPVGTPASCRKPGQVADLLKEHPSIPYNPDIAATFFRAGLIEAWGRGTLKIIRECENAGLPQPSFPYDQAGFRIEFQRVEGKMLGKVLALIKENHYITISELSEKTGVTERTIQRNLRKLQEAHLLKRIGGAKGGHWEVMET